MACVESKLRCFSSLIGLAYQGKEEEFRVWTREDVKIIVQQWIHQRLQDNQIHLCVIVSAEESLLYHTGNDIFEQPCVRVHGEVMQPNLTVTDSKIKEAVIDLFTFLKTELKQYSIQVCFQGYHENVSFRII